MGGAAGFFSYHTPLEIALWVGTPPQLMLVMAMKMLTWMVNQLVTKLLLLMYKTASSAKEHASGNLHFLFSPLIDPPRVLSPMANVFDPV